MNGGPYDVQFASPAQRALVRLPSRVAHAVMEFIVSVLAEDPHRASKPLRNELADLRSARRGDYRILLRIDDERRTVFVVDIDHRAHIYRTAMTAAEVPRTVPNTTGEAETR